jgi:hypothetical protein
MIRIKNKILRVRMISSCLMLSWFLIRIKRHHIPISTGKEISLPVDISNQDIKLRLLECQHQISPYSHYEQAQEVDQP